MRWRRLRLPPHLFFNSIPQRIMAHFDEDLYLDDGFELDYYTPQAFWRPFFFRRLLAAAADPVEGNQQQNGVQGLPLLQLSEWDLPSTIKPIMCIIIPLSGSCR